MLRSRLPHCSSLLLTAALAGQGPFGPTLLADLNTDPVTGPARSSVPAPLAASGGRVLMTATVEGFGREPWLCDGTAAGTFPLADLRSGSGSSDPGAGLALPGGMMLFVADSTTSGRELFAVPPGSATVQVLEIRPGPAGAFDAGSIALEPLVEWYGSAWFLADDGTHGQELWTSDGTVQGTALAHDLAPGAVASTHFEDWVQVAGGKLYFTTTSPVAALWVKSSPAAAPVMLLPLPAQRSEPPSTASAAAGALVFVHRTAAAGEELWRSDGTAAGTRLLADIWPGSNGSRPRPVHGDGSRYWFTAEAPGFGRELWSTDGSATGTRMVADIAPGAGSSMPASAVPSQDRIPFGNGILFAADDGTRGRELWFSDGTAAGTRLIADLWSGGSPSLPRSMFALGGRVCFTADDGVHGAELWVTDGSTAGTRLLVDLDPMGGSAPAFVGHVRGGAVLKVWSQATGAEPWLTDGSAAGTRLLLNLNPEPATMSSAPRALRELRGRLVFSARDAATGNELWASDGTAAGTRRLADLLPGPASSDPEPIGQTSAGLLFAADSAMTGRDLWVTDGTTAGTTLLKHFAGNVNVAIGDFADHTWFRADDGSGDVLWRSDGTAAGTVQAVGFPVAPQQPGAVVNGVLVFSGYTPGSGHELWCTDGSAAGTVMIADLEVGPGSSRPRSFLPFGDRVAFVACTSAHGCELWSTDGTSAGTSLVVDLFPGPISSGASPGVALQDKLLFRAADGLRGIEPWITDGTPAGTRLLADIVPGTGDSLPTFADRASGSVAFFWALDVQQRPELWKTDGTAAATVRVAPPLPNMAAPPGLVAVGSGELVVFRHDDLTHGVELWISDGTAAGTRLLADSAPGGASSWPGRNPFEAPLRAGTHVFFAADDGVTGVELHSMPLGALGAWVAEPYGAGCGGELSTAGSARLGAVLAIDLAAKRPSTPALLLADVAAAATRVATDCWLHLQAPQVIAAPIADLSGLARVTLRVPNDPTLLQRPVYFQYLALAPAGRLFGALELSRGLEVIAGR